MSRTDPLWPLNAEESELVRCCVAATVDGPFFRWWWFPADDPHLRPEPAKHHPARCRIVSRERYDRASKDEWREYHAIFGLYPSEVSRILQAWPDFRTLPDAYREEQLVELAINNSMNNLLGYPHRCYDVWDEYIPVPPEAIAKLFDKWKSLRRPPREEAEGEGAKPSRRYFDDLM